MRTIALVSLAIGAAALAACQQFNAQVVDPLLTDLAKINATAGQDLTNAKVVALAANPPDQDGANCIDAALSVGKDIDAVLGAANQPNSGVLTTAELASLFQPGSIQYNTAKQKLTSGCAAKAQDVMGPMALAAAGGVTTAIAAGQVLPMLAAVP